MPHRRGMEEVDPLARRPVEPAAVLRELSQAACRELLASRDVGRLAYVVEGYPVVVPVNYAYAGDRIWIRSGQGGKLEHAPLRAVSLEIDELQSDTRTGWSVLARGLASWAGEDDRDDPGPVPWITGPFPARLVVKVRHLSGRRIERVPAAACGPLDP